MTTSLSMSTPSIEYAWLLPMLSIFGVAVAGVVVEAFLPRRRRYRTQLVLCGGGLVSALISVVALVGTRGMAVAGAVAVDGFGGEARRRPGEVRPRQLPESQRGPVAVIENRIGLRPVAHEDKRRFEEDFGQGPRIRDPGEEVASEPMPVAASHPDGLGDGLGGAPEFVHAGIGGVIRAARGAAGPGKPRDRAV